MFDRIRAHPIQGILGLLGGALGGPLVGQGLRMGFNAYNNHQFNNNTEMFQANQQQAANDRAQQAMQQPLNGVLGSFDGSGYGGQIPQSGNYGGLGGLGGYNMSQQYGQQYGQHPLSGLLDFLGSQQQQGPGGSFANGTLPLGGGPAQGGGGGGHGGFMGSNGGGNNGEFSIGRGANGEAFITGGNARWDPNQGAVARRYPGH